MKDLRNTTIKPEDYEFAYSIWRKSTQDSAAIGVVCDLFRTNAREVRRVLDIQRLKYMQRVNANTEANRIHASNYQ